MLIFCNADGEIKDVGVNSQNDKSLVKYEINDAENPFDGWSVAKICCYKVTVSNGVVTMMTPYIDSRLIEHIEQLGKQTEDVQTTVSGEYQKDKTYAENEYCLWNGELYRFIRMSGIGIEPSNKNYWVHCDIATELNRILGLIK